ncbi:hypothetical protein PVNG_04454 [Plasmodium vivax North Korean]|uniref:Uncharacterized protein n=1 Tax=Plasmodium vivax North Korean TaxID=1035514 RepID=A0A0J9U4Z1_PLAVI|nr:hypothetical protein PVNG_04454 [Plasmodium vivax North Korean]
MTYTKESNTDFCNQLGINSYFQFTTICKKFVTLFKAFKAQCSPSETNWINKKYPEFMNFWLNNQLYTSGYNEANNSEFYNKLEPNLNQFGAEDALKDKMYVIKKKNLNNMSLLYEVYKIFYTSSDKPYKKCDNFLGKFKTDYNTALNKCYYDGDIKLCEGIQKFYDLYKQKVSKIVPGCENVKFPKLPELTLFESGDNTILKTSKIGPYLRMTKQIEILGKLAQLKSENYEDLKYLVSLYYNMLFEPNETERKYVMINVLYQFIQYCNENKKNLKLSLFMEEFLGEYYQKNVTEYQQIFRECNTDSNTNTYCQLHKECNDKFGKDLSLIKEDSSKYISQQKDFIKNLSALDKWIINAKALFQDSEAMSRILPTIMSTIEFRESILKDLHKYKLYDKLNENVDPDLYNSYCRGIKISFPKNNDLDKICHMFVRNLITLPSILEEEDDSERCKYFTFWIHDQINKNIILYGLNSRTKNFFLLKFYQVENKIIGEGRNNDCFFEYISKVGIDLWIKWKDLYDYIKNYNDIKEKINSDNKWCKIYNSYYNYIKDVYTNFKNECCKGSREKCPYNLKFKDWCDKDDIFTKIKCEQPVEADVSSSEHKEDIAAQPEGAHRGKHKTEEEDGRERKLGEPGGGKANIREVEDVAGVEGEGKARRIQFERHIPTPDRVFDVNEESTNPNKSNKVGTIGATVAGSSLFLLMMYKVKKHI